MILISTINFIGSIILNLIDIERFYEPMCTLSIPAVIEIMTATTFTEFDYDNVKVIGFLSGLQTLIRVFGPYKQYMVHHDWEDKVHVYKEQVVTLSSYQLICYGLIQMVNFYLILYYYKENKPTQHQILLKQAQKSNERDIEKTTSDATVHDLTELSFVSQESKLTKYQERQRQFTLKVQDDKIKEITFLQTEEDTRGINQNFKKKEQLTFTYEDDPSFMDLDQTVNITMQTKFNSEREKQEEALPVIKFSEFKEVFKTPRLKVYLVVYFFIVLLEFTYSINFNTFLQNQYCEVFDCPCDKDVVVLAQSEGYHWAVIGSSVFVFQTFIFPELLKKFDRVKIFKSMAYVQWSTFLVSLAMTVTSSELSCIVREILVDLILIVRFIALTSVYAILCLIINENVNIQIRGRLYAIIIACTNLQQHLIPLLTSYYIFKFNHGQQDTLNNQDYGRNFYTIFLISALFFSFILIVFVHRLEMMV